MDKDFIVGDKVKYTERFLSTVASSVGIDRSRRGVIESIKGSNAWVRWDQSRYFVVRERLNNLEVYS